MTTLQKLKGAAFLSQTETYNLAVDLALEFEDFEELRHTNNRPYVAWFLRNYAYTPMTLISEILGYGGAAYMAADAISEYAGSLTEKPASLAGSHYGSIQLSRSLIDNHYGMSSNMPLDRIVSEHLEDAFLWTASCACGVKDPVRRLGGGKNSESWFRHTPSKAPVLVSLLEIEDDIAYGIDLEVIANKFKVTKIN